MALSLCVCGTVRSVNGGNLRRGGSLGCGCTKKGLRKRPYEALYNSISTVNPEREIKLTYEEFLVFTTEGACHYCGEIVIWTPHHITKNGSNYNLDRKDNSKGYLRDNLVVCCARCNRAKSNHFTYEQFLQIGALIKSWKQEAA